MEWDPIDDSFIDDFDEEEEFIFSNHQKDEYMEWEDEYQLYLDNLADDEYLSNINTLIENYRNEGNDYYWCSWWEVPEEYKLDVYKIFMYQTDRNLCPPIVELNDDKAYYNYLLFLANVLRNT